MSYLKSLFNLENKVVLITGVNGQLGATLSRAFSEVGGVVVGTDVQQSDSLLPDVDFYEMDVVNRDNTLETFEKVFDNHKRIDILINNAGVSTFEPFEQRPEEKIDWVMDVNLKGVFNCIQGYVNLFDRNNLEKGNIINVASHYGVISPDFRIYTQGDRKNSEIYGATKAGVIQMTRYFAVHLADRNIRVNSIAPGGVYNPVTPQREEFIEKYSYRVPMKRMANQEEIIGAALYLGGDSSSYTNGHNIIIDGGMSCW